MTDSSKGNEVLEIINEIDPEQIKALIEAAESFNGPVFYLVAFLVILAALIYAIERIVKLFRKGEEPTYSLPADRWTTLIATIEGISQANSSIVEDLREIRRVAFSRNEED